MTKVKIVTFSDDNIKGYASISEGINKTYAAKHGYNFEAYHNKVLGDEWDVQWEKVRILNEELKKKDNSYVVWIDADAAFNLHDIPLESYMGRGDITVSHDGVNKREYMEEAVRDEPWYVNTGVVIVKNTPWSQTFVKRWMDEAGQFKKGSDLQDQDKFVDMLKKGWEEDNLSSHINVLGPKAINSEYNNDTQNTFVWHLMKRDESYRKTKFNELLARITNEKPDDISDMDKVKNAYDSRFRSDSSKHSPVLIVMMYDDGIIDYSAVAENVNRKYAAAHGYDLMAVRDRLSERDPQWDKVRTMSIVMNDIPESSDHKWFFWIDSDAVFAQHDVPLQSILDEGGEFVISDDLPNRGVTKAPDGEIYINTGTFGLKNTTWAKEFVKKWWETPMGMENKLYHEQHVLNKLYESDEGGLKQKMVVHPHDRLNSAFGNLPSASAGRDKLKNTFVLHMMRKPADVRRIVFDKVEQMVAEEKISPRPSHVVDPPDRYYKVKPLSTKEPFLVNQPPKWLLYLILCILAVFILITFICYVKKRRGG
jgi:hypothetical protein